VKTPAAVPVVLLLAVALLLVICSPAEATRIAIYDQPAGSALRELGDCIEVVDGEDGTATGMFYKPGAPYYNIWLYAPTGCVTASSDSLTTVVCIQYHSCDSNDGVSDIYVDDMATPLLRIDAYLRGSWYVEIYDLPAGQHEVKVCASGDSDMTGVVPSPHRVTPALGDNDVWRFCFSDTRTIPPDGVPDPSNSYVDWGNLAADGSTVLSTPQGNGSMVGMILRDRDDDPVTNALVTVEFSTGCGFCRCETVTTVSDSFAGVAFLPATMGLDRYTSTSCCVVTSSVRCMGAVIPWSGHGSTGRLADYRSWVSPDLDGECTVSVVDYAIFVLDNGTTACRSDFDGSGIVDTTDFNIFSAHFMEMCAPITGVVDQPAASLLAPVLEQNCPNPFSPETRLAFHVAAPGVATLRIHNAAGRLVRVLEKDCASPGRYELAWDGRDSSGRRAATGVYFVRLETAEGSEVKRMVLMR
jgi:hypothetical protein